MSKKLLKHLDQTIDMNLFWKKKYSTKKENFTIFEKIFMNYTHDFIILNFEMSFSHMTFVNTDTVRADRKSAPLPNTSKNLFKYFIFVCTINPDAIVC